MEHLSSAMEHQDQHQDQLRVQWRRDKVQELCSKGYRQREISQVLQRYIISEESSQDQHQKIH